MAVVRTGSAPRMDQSGASATIMPPPGAGEGNLAMVNLSVPQNTVTSFVGPLGSVELVNKLAGNGMICGVYYKILTATDLTNGLRFSMADGATRNYSAGIATYAGFNGNAPIHVQGIGADGGTVLLATPYISTTLPDCMIFVSYHVNFGSTVDSLAMDAPTTELWDGSSSNTTANRNASGGDDLLVGTVSNFRRTANIVSAIARVSQSHIFAIAPGSSDTTPPAPPTGLQAIYL